MSLHVGQGMGFSLVQAVQVISENVAQPSELCRPFVAEAEVESFCRSHGI